jgi:hypothetical protein
MFPPDSVFIVLPSHQQRGGGGGVQEVDVYRWESNLAILSSPVTNNNIQFIVRRTATMGKQEHF